MREHVTEDGEVIEEARSPLQIAKSELAAFKFRLLETVAADPKLSSAPCLNAIVVFMSFVTIDERTLKPTTAYASLTTLMAKGGMKRSAANMARRILLREGYLAPTGSKTKEGCAKYRLENPHVERVQMHVQEAMEYWQAIAAEQRAEERRKKAMHDVVSEYDTTQQACGVSGNTTGCQNTTPITLEDTLEIEALKRETYLSRLALPLPCMVSFLKKTR